LESEYVQAFPSCRQGLLALNVLPEFAGVSKLPHRDIQFVRSTPGIIAPPVGQKSQEHVKENLEILPRPVLNDSEFFDLIKKLTV